MRGGRLIIVLSLTLWILRGSTVVGFPTEPSESWVYPYLYELRLRHPGDRIFVGTGPYSRLETAAWLESCRMDEAGRRSLWLYGMLTTEFEDEIQVLEAGSGWAGDVRIQSEVETGEKPVGQAIGRFAYYSPAGVAMWSSLRSSLNGQDVHKVGTRVWSDRGRASVDYAGIALNKAGFMVSLSRDEVSWGADRRNGLLFSGSAPCFDMVSFGYRTSRVAFTSFHSRLRGRWDGDDTEDVRRYVSAHRLELLPGSRFTFALSEAVLYGGRYRSFEPVYLNPFTVFYSDQWNSGWNDNILIAGDFSLLFPRRAEIRGEVMIDDFQYDFSNEPHEFGAGLVVNAVNPLSPGTSTVEASYYHIRNQTYGHLVAWNRFIQEGKVMGYEDGPDGDRLTLAVLAVRPESMQWKAAYVFRRKGEGSATDVQEEKGPSVDFPSGIVETTHRVDLTLSWRPCHRWLVEAGARYHTTRNAGHVEGVDDDGWDLSLNAQLNLKMNTWLWD